MCRRNRIVRSSTAIVVVGLLAAGCGSDSESGAATSPAPPSSEARPATPSERPVDTEPQVDATSATPQDTDPSPEATTGALDPESTSAVPTSTETDRCRRLTDFDGDETADWFVVNDGVMGGRSNGAIEIADSALRFSGSVVTRGGGFTSVRLRLTGGELAGTNRIDMRVRADQRTYGLTFEDDAVAGQRSVSHRADLVIDEQRDDWTIATLTYADLLPSVFGQLVDADPFDPDEAREIGIIISDGTDGEFALEVDWIDACR